MTDVDMFKPLLKAEDRQIEVGTTKVIPYSLMILFLKTIYRSSKGCVSNT